MSDPIQKWASPGIKVIRISEGYSNQFLELRVREFVPQEGDKLCRSWSHNGVKKSVELPPYALVNLDEGKFAYDKHIEGSLNQTCNTFAGEPGGLLYRTYMQMLKLCKIQGSNGDERHVRMLLQETFKLWMSVRLTTKSVFIVGEERLGMPEDILDETSPTPGAIPLPPVMGAQLDLILIHHIQTKLRRQVLEKLEKMISKRKHNTWMITYLVTFVLLHNTSLITAHDAGYARKHEMNVSCGDQILQKASANGFRLQRRFAREDKVREYHLGRSSRFLEVSAHGEQSLTMRISRRQYPACTFSLLQQGRSPLLGRMQGSGFAHFGGTERGPDPIHPRDTKLCETAQ